MKGSFYVHAMFGQLDYRDRRNSGLRPGSKFRYLVEQVHEQSPLCDFTVKVKSWTKRFHRCVLVSCPFFDRAMRGNFTEKRTGLVDVSVGTPDSVEMAIMYLYGVVPDISIDNVKLLLQQAEYFMIEGLKTTCINWLRDFEITEKTYIYVLKLASVYNFEVPNGMAYIESHLPEVFKTEDALYFSRELIQKLFTDERLSYVSMDERLSFLMHWVKINSYETKANVKELFDTIDLQDITDSLLREASCVGILNENMFSSDVESTLHGGECKCDVLIMTGEKGSLLCFNPQNDTWYKLIPENSNDILYRNISGIRNTKPELYFTKGEGHMMPMVTTLNIITNEINTYKFTLKDEDISRETITNVCLADNTLLVLTRKHVQIIETLAGNQTKNKKIDADCPGTSSSHIDLESSQKRVRIPIICDDERLYPEHFRSEDQNITVKDTVNTAVHAGSVTNENVEVVPIFYLRNIDISRVCLNSTLSTVALLPKDQRSVILFDLISYKMETFCLEQATHYKMSTTNKGFVIYNNKRCYCLTNMYWSLPSQRYLIELFELESDDHRTDYLFCNGFWVKFLKIVSYIDPNLEMSFIRHEELLMSKSPTDLKTYKLLSSNEMFGVQLSKKKLRCHIHCPHCKYSQRQSSYKASRIYFRYTDPDDQI
ncbi:uncharacterized protein LOC132716516 [Ruditapes philippinarum]|uniref:uncharacterized protein LOC132716516 n=1 Tax=Ruditapes philippinarum TaxID=129788 RepID=UPI00295B5254|nr:uncharacterized protein LOC132716516 [Ruditapes philippinarum]